MSTSQAEQCQHLVSPPTSSRHFRLTDSTNEVTCDAQELLSLSRFRLEVEELVLPVDGGMAGLILFDSDLLVLIGSCISSRANSSELL